MHFQKISRANKDIFVNGIHVHFTQIVRALSQFNWSGFDTDVISFSLFISKLLSVFFDRFLISIFITRVLISFVSVSWNFSQQDYRRLCIKNPGICKNPLKRSQNEDYWGKESEVSSVSCFDWKDLIIWDRTILWYILVPTLYIILNGYGQRWFNREKLFSMRL